MKRKNKTLSRLCRLSCLVALMLISIVSTGYAQQTITIEDCYTAARNNYPLLKQVQLISRSKEYSLDNAVKGTYPQLNISGQATYQSDVTEIPISVPGMNVSKLNKDQYKLYGEVSQPLTDLYTIQHQKDIINVNAVVEEQKLEVELYRLKERINQLFFGILIIDEQLMQVTLLKKDIQVGIDKTNAAIANGTALKSNADVLKAELIKTDQHRIELKAARKGYADMLAVFINQSVDEHTVLKRPVPQVISSVINRPELKLYEFQKRSYLLQNKLIDDRNLPKLSVFMQGGYGRPALNMLKNDFRFYYIGGLKISWNLSSLYTYKNEKRIITNSQHMVDVQKETFLFNSNISLKQQDSEIGKYTELISSDREIIGLREKVKTTAGIQLENGVITANDYLSYVNAEDQARQNLLVHEIQRLMAQYNYQTTSGN